MVRKTTNNRDSKDAKRHNPEVAGLSGVRLIIGLGNPGREYQNTRHNAGFLFVDYLKRNCPDSELTHPAETATSATKPKQILTSDVYMNESGKCVKKIAKKYKARPEEILIAHDDSDIALGKYKLSFGRGSAGHKGAQSVIDNLGTKNFWRLRIGIRPESERRAASFFVLSKIRLSEQKKLALAFEKMCDLIDK